MTARQLKTIPFGSCPCGMNHGPFSGRPMAEPQSLGNLRLWMTRQWLWHVLCQARVTGLWQDTATGNSDILCPDDIIVSPQLSAKDQIQDPGEKIGVSFPNYREHLMLGGCWGVDIVSPQLSEENHLFLTETHLWWSVLQILMRCIPPTQLLLVSARLTGEWVV